MMFDYVPGDDRTDYKRVPGWARCADANDTADLNEYLVVQADVIGQGEERSRRATRTNGHDGPTRAIDGITSVGLSVPRGRLDQIHTDVPSNAQGKDKNAGSVDLPDISDVTKRGEPLLLGTTDSRVVETMPNVSFNSLRLGEQYDRKELAAFWGYEDWQAIGRGCVTPANHKCLVFFITKNKQESITQYANYFEGDILHIEGETNHAADRRILNARAAGDEIHLFYRDTHHSPFTYFGPIDLIEHQLKTGAPSLFVFQTRRGAALAQSAIAAEDRAHGLEDADPEDRGDTNPDGEGRRRLSTSVRYERSVKNRELAIKRHGTRCKVCQFDFNAFYGADLARDFIQVHHTRSITELNGTAPDVENELVPLCANCHCMAHRERGRIVPVEELKERIAKARM